MGVVREKIVARMYFLDGVVEWEREAICVPRAIPSKNWWNVITVKRRRKPLATSGAITRVRPITVGPLLVVSSLAG